MPKSDTWPGGVGLETMTSMESAGSCDSVVSANSGFVSKILLNVRIFANLFSIIKQREIWEINGLYLFPTEWWQSGVLVCWREGLSHVFGGNDWVFGYRGGQRIVQWWTWPTVQPWKPCYQTGWPVSVPGQEQVQWWVNLLGQIQKVLKSSSNKQPVKSL